jgi:hypothetical protein
MISKTRRPIEVLALLLRATTASAQDNRGTTEQRATSATRRLQTLRQLHSRPHEGRVVPEAEQVRSQRSLPIGLQSTGPTAQQKQ